MFSEDKNIRIVQEEALTALKYFHHLCVEHSINYTVHAGTMLGAVREQGFIPWDDDVDLGMTREEYSKFETLINSIQLDEYYSFDNFSYVSPRLCLHRPGKPLVWVTIFIYDYVDEHKWIQMIKTKGIGIFYFMLNGHDKTPIKVVGSPIKAFLINIVRGVGKRISRETILERYRFFCEKTMVGNKKWIQRANDRYCDQGVDIVLPKEVMEGYMTMCFEDTEVMISKFYDYILTTSYGADYMTPQKDNMRTVVHQEIRKNLENV